MAVYSAISSDAPPGTSMGQLGHPKGSTLLDVLPAPDSIPSWLTEEELDYYVAFFEEHGFRGPINWYRNIPVMNEVTPELATKQVAQPSAFVAGAKDPVLEYIPGQSWVDLMKPFLSDCQFIAIVEGAGHWVQLERPEETTREILRFLDLVR